jgi:uracil-DNA glycosylase family 4
VSPDAARPFGGMGTREEAARLLRQRLEMGATDVFLDGMTREEALSLLSTAPGTGAGPGVSGQAVVRKSPSPREGRTEAMPSAGPVGPSAPRPSRPAPAPAAAPVPMPSSELPVVYDELRAEALACTRCSLAEGRTQVVFSDGPAQARLMVVGEAPGASEDETGVPFVGAAGKYLDLLLATVGLSRSESVYIANVLKCRPPGNRNPLPAEIEACSPFLRRQIDLVRPEALLAVGSFAGQLLTGRERVALGSLRGTVHSYHGVPLVVTYHPAALLRNPNWTRAFWSDLQLLRSVMDGTGST